jgi:chaperone modulatory protein CbpM
MTQLDAIVILFPDLEAAELSIWIERRWVEPDIDGTGNWAFREIDIARVRLIYDLRRRMDVAEDTIPLVLSLLDQLYDVRCTVKAMTQALKDLPPEVQAAVRSALKQRNVDL